MCPRCAGSDVVPPVSVGTAVRLTAAALRPPGHHGRRDGRGAGGPSDDRLRVARLHSGHTAAGVAVVEAPTAASHGEETARIPPGTTLQRVTYPVSPAVAPAAGPSRPAGTPDGRSMLLGTRPATSPTTSATCAPDRLPGEQRKERRDAHWTQVDRERRGSCKREAHQRNRAVRASPVPDHFKEDAEQRRRLDLRLPAPRWPGYGGCWRPLPGRPLPGVVIAGRATYSGCSHPFTSLGVGWVRGGTGGGPVGAGPSPPFLNYPLATRWRLLPSAAHRSQCK